MADAHHIDIGKLKCIIFNDGCLVDPGETFALNCIYIEGGGRKLLVDDGYGKSLQVTTAGKFVDNIIAEGIKPGDIDTIIFDHGHIDHVRGTFDNDGNPVFPSARYIITKKEWEYIAAGPTDNQTQNTFYASARRFLLPLRDRVELVSDNYNVLPGIKIVPSHGHTPGNSMIDIISNGERLLCVGDIIHSLQEFTDLEHCAAFDVFPEQAVNARARVLKKVVRDGTLVFVAHFAFPGLGHIRQKNGVLSWEALGP